MIAKAPPNLADFLKLTARSPLLLGISCSKSIVQGHGLRHCDFSQTTLKCPKTRAPMIISAAYTRSPMDTPGAYQLIDDETGEKFILLGGINDDSPIPSKEVLSWKPTNGAGPNDQLKKKKQQNTTSGNHGNKGGVESATRAAKGKDPRTHIEGSSQAFGRLKVPRVRSLIRKKSQIKQEIVADDYVGSGLVDTPFNVSDSSDPEHELIMEKKSRGVIRHRENMSRTTRSQEVRDLRRGRETIPGSKQSDVVRKKESEQLSKDQITPLKPREHEHAIIKPEVSVTTAASLRGWNSGEPRRSSRFDFTDHSMQRRKLSADAGFFSRKSFSDLGYSDFMIESLRGQLFLRPSHIQALASSPVMDGRSCIIADQSGSGKTLAYLAPVIQRLRQEELQGLGKSSSGSPRVVVLVPTAELASQVLSNCRSMSKFGVPFRSMVATGGFRQKTQLESLEQDLDVLIATPGRFIYLLKEGFLRLTNLKCAVLDEVDILFGDEDFEQVLQCLTSSAPVTTQYLFVTATLPVDIYNKLVEVFPDCEVIMGPGVHRTSSGLEEFLVDCSGDDGAEKNPETAFFNKKSALLQIAEENPASKTIVFCNKIETCRKVENVLKRFDRKELRIRVLPFHAALAQEARLANMKEFLNSKSKEENLFLICTDRASRGIDFADVDHVVLFDFPRDPSEYVRRVGRTARGAGGTGKAFVFVVGKQVSLARRIMERNLKGHPLHDVPSAYEVVS